MKFGQKNHWMLILITLTLVFQIISSCDNDNYNSSEFEAGEAFTDSKIRILKIDTLTVETSTMKFDSLATSESTRMLVGRYRDSIFGTVNTSSYAQIIPTAYTIDVKAEYDSIMLYLKMDSYYYNDTLQTNNIHIKKINQNLHPDSGDYLYNTSSISYDEEDIGNISFKPRPLTKDSLEIKISDSLGLAIFENLQDKTILNSDEFKNFFKGIAILPDATDDGSIIGFSLSSYVRLYHSTAESEERVQSYIDLQINTTATPIPFFNKISSENPIAPLQTLTNEELNLKSEDSNNQSFIQSGVGVAMKITFPHLKSLYDINGTGTVLDAVLKLKPVAQSYDDKLMLKDSLSFFVVNKRNELIDGVSNITAILNRDNQEFNDIYYEAPISIYIEELITTDQDIEEGLILFPNDYISGVDRLILQGNDSNNFESILEITYAVYNEG